MDLKQIIEQAGTQATNLYSNLNMAVNNCRMAVDNTKMTLIKYLIDFSIESNRPEIQNLTNTGHIPTALCFMGVYRVHKAKDSIIRKGRDLAARIDLYLKYFLK